MATPGIGVVAGDEAVTTRLGVEGVIVVRTRVIVRTGRIARCQRFLRNAG
jgi:hypothetical protein